MVDDISKRTNELHWIISMSNNYSFTIIVTIFIYITIIIRYAAEKANPEISRLLLNQVTQDCEINYTDKMTGKCSLFFNCLYYHHLFVT